MISEDQALELVREALRAAPCSIQRQTLTQSGNAIFRVGLEEGTAVVLRVSPRRGTFTRTPDNLAVLGGLGLPVQRVLGAGPTAQGGSFIILDWLPGRDLMYELPHLRPTEMTGIAQTIVQFQKAAGTLPEGQAFGWAPIGGKPACARWSEVFGPPVPEDAPLDEADPMGPMRRRLQGLRRALEPAFAAQRPICFLDEVILRNVLVEGGRLRGLIDLDYVCYGDPLLSVGTTLAAIATDVGEAGRFYGEELLRFWEPSPGELRAIRFYSALWCVGLLSAAVNEGDLERIKHLAPITKDLLRLAEEPA